MPNRTIAALVALCGLGFAATAHADDSRIRYRCGAEGANDISMSAKYETRASRRKFSVEFEAAPAAGFADGDKLGVRVDGTAVGSVTLGAIRGGDVVGDLNYDTKPTEDDADPFPAKFPKTLGRGAKIRLSQGDKKVLACELR
ncbi:hypothetical protein [Methylopila sp. M107]|uniref:hypothetical protein n=1 Tax=Methylopila sp. M107 TaxID=1101190 RepID=UPI000380DA12|nr:hypothetical protein [Methylopila sp. M107]